MRSRATGWLREAVDGVKAVDLLVGFGLLAIGLVDALTTQEYAGGRARLLVAVVLQTLPLVWQRAHTVAAVGLSMLGVAVEVAGEEPYGGVYGLLGFLVLVHAVARWTSGSARLRGVALLLAGVVIHTLSQSTEGPLGILGGLVFVGVSGAVAWSVGMLLRRSADREAELAEAAATAEAAWAERNTVVIEQERARISRELHDVVGHALAGISLTAGAAELRAEGRDSEMSSALALIRTLSRDAASDVRRLVELLREESDAEEGSRPQPTLAQVPELVDRARAAGLAVTLHEVGAAVPIPGGVHLSAYRVVQEGLTNVVRHAPDAVADVTLRWLPSRLEVTVENSAAAGAHLADQHQGGHGLVGLRERVTVFDGSLTARATPEGGFVLCAGFPLP